MTFSCMVMSLVPPPMSSVWPPFIAEVEATMERSYAAYLSRDEGSDSWGLSDKDGSWVRWEKLTALRTMIDSLQLNRSSELSSFLYNSPVPLYAPLSSSLSYDLTLMHIPPQCSMPPRYHSPGTVVVYKKLYGRGHCRRIIVNREIGRDEFEDSLQMRLGGMQRVLESVNASRLGILELVLYPPRRQAEGLSGIGGFVSAESSIMEVNIPLQGEQGGCLVNLFESKRPSPNNIAATIEKSKVSLLQGLGNSIGGLDEELRTIVRRVLLSRQIEPKMLKTLGLSHVRGLLLYGPPGCGKTLIARELAAALDARKPKIVNGPELMNKYLGESERNIRELFLDAKLEWEERGLDSALHVIVFDELDAMARVRGGGGGDGDRTGDSCVNQLLTLLDGVSEMTNVLVIGLTNRIDLIDPALLRPGRLEVHIEIKEPDEMGRREILRLLLTPPFEAGFLGVDGDGLEDLIEDLAIRTSGFTGAELTGLTRNAASHALERLSEEHLTSSAIRDYYRIEPEDIGRALYSELRRFRRSGNQGRQNSTE